MSRVVIAILFTTSAWAQSQEGRYMVFFKQKLGPETLYSVDNPTAFLSQKSIDRRRLQGIAVIEEDFPVSPDYIAELVDLNVPVHYTLRWVNGALVEVQSEQLEAIKALLSVARVEYVAPPSVALGNGEGIVEIPPPNPNDGGVLRNATQLAMIGLDDMHADNRMGEGVSIAVLDNGFNGVDIIAPFKPLFQDNRVEYTYDFVGHSTNVFRSYGHGTAVLSIMAASLPGIYMGGSPQATYQLYVTEDGASEYRVEEYNWMAAAERADSVGADIITSSLGYYAFEDATMNYTKEQMDGKTAIISQAATKALARGITVVISAGNLGATDWQLISVPADVAGVLAVGSVTAEYERAPFSSIGPTADGRIKPDVAALGSKVLVIGPNGAFSPVDGTSVSSPLIASLAAGLLQAFPESTPEQLYALIISSGSKSNSPDNSLGYGIPDYVLARDRGKNPIITALHATEEKKTSPFVLYPNPLSGNYVEVRLNNPYLQSNANRIMLSIHDLYGKQVRVVEGQVDPTGAPMRYNIATLPAGFYLAKIQYGANRQIVKLVKY